MPRDKEQEKANHSINAGIREDKRRNEKTLQLLFLGSQNSGKDNIIHQIRIINDSSYSEFYRPIIYDLCFSSICFLSIAAQALEFRMTTQNQGASERLCEERKKQTEGSVEILTPEHARDIMALWHDPAIQHAYQQNPSMHLYDSIPYFFSLIEDLARPNYTPSAQDILHIQLHSSPRGIQEISMEISGLNIKLLNFNGQRNDNIKKWIHCFDVTLVVYCVSAKEFMSNDTPESLALFEDLRNSYLRSTAILILLYKDIPDISQEATSQIFERFWAVGKADSLIRRHEVSETDTDILQVILDSARDSILTAIISDSVLDKKNCWYWVCCCCCCCC